MLYYQVKFNEEKKKKILCEILIDSFSLSLEEPDENNDVDSSETAGMSLETFIGRDVVDMGPVMQVMETEEPPLDQEDSQMNNEAITTEDILGKKSKTNDVPFIFDPYLFSFRKHQ